jgi:hypothetical protein
VKKVEHEDAGCPPPVHDSFSRIYDAISRSSKRDGSARALTPRSVGLKYPFRKAKNLCASRREQISRYGVLHCRPGLLEASIMPYLADFRDGCGDVFEPAFALLGASC